MPFIKNMSTVSNCTPMAHAKLIPVGRIVQGLHKGSSLPSCSVVLEWPSALVPKTSSTED